MRQSPRVRRLNADFQSVLALQAESSIFAFESRGTPPQRYRLIFKGAGLQRDDNGRISFRQHHEILVELGAAYPRMVPNLAWQTPIFHPNISNNGVVCLGSYGTHWVPSLTLSEMATMLWDMIRYKNFDTDSPYNREAALWAKSQTDLRFPIDPRSIRDRVSSAGYQPATSPREVTDVQIIPSRPTTPEVQVTRVADRAQDPVHILGVTDDGIEIIEAEIARPQAREDDGILFLD